VLGNDYVDAAVARQNAFNRDFQDYVTRGVWGSIWTRPGLDLKTRELLLIASCTTLGHVEPQLRAHIDAARRVGATREEIVETILQMLFYAGGAAVANALIVAGDVLDAWRQACDVAPRS
jgi:4-carboxymuconolactone decarboxylase